EPSSRVIHARALAVARVRTSKLPRRGEEDLASPREDRGTTTTSSLVLPGSRGVGEGEPLTLGAGNISWSDRISPPLGCRPSARSDALRPGFVRLARGVAAVFVLGSATRCRRWSIGTASYLACLARTDAAATWNRRRWARGCAPSHTADVYSLTRSP